MGGKEREERQLIHNGKNVPIEKHLGLGDGGPDTCRRFYFYDDESAGQFVIGHVGRQKKKSET